MNILAKSIVSNSDMIKNYKSCRKMADDYGNIFILKNNKPDAVLFSISKYERFSSFIEYIESLEQEDRAKVVELLQLEGIGKTYSIEHSKEDIS